MNFVKLMWLIYVYNEDLDKPLDITVWPDTFLAGPDNVKNW